jgi:hypothetical protein
MALCEEIGADVSALAPAERTKQLAVAKRLIGAGATPEEIRRETRWLMAQSWVDGVDLFLLEKQRGKWVLAGRPEAPSRRRDRPDYRDL